MAHVRYPNELAAVEQAVVVAGNQTKLAASVGCPQQYVSNWINRDGRCSAAWVLAVERVTGVSRHQLRPDLYPIC